MCETKNESPLQSEEVEGSGAEKACFFIALRLAMANLRPDTVISSPLQAEVRLITIAIFTDPLTLGAVHAFNLPYVVARGWFSHLGIEPARLDCGVQRLGDQMSVDGTGVDTVDMAIVEHHIDHRLYI